MSSRRYQPILVLAAVCFGSLTPGRSADVESGLRQYVAKCVASPNFYVLNPPAELNAYAGEDQGALRKRMLAAATDGSILILYPSGLPFQLKTTRNRLADGPGKAWSADGRLQTDEVYEAGKLKTGHYYSAEGKLIAEVKDGAGVQLEFVPKDGEHGLTVRRESQIQGGEKSGRERLFNDYDKGRVQTESIYREGKKNGPEKGYMPDGKPNFQTSYVSDREDGETVYWWANGHVQSLSSHKAGRETGNSSRYYESGGKASETIRAGELTVSEARWYPEGGLMVYQSFDSAAQRVKQGWSFDRDGSQNGSVVDGAGALVITGDTSFAMAPEEFNLQIFGRDVIGNEKLPVLRWTAINGKDNVAEFKFAVPTPSSFKRFQADIIPPGANAVPVSLEWSAGDKEEKTVRVPWPSKFETWSGNLYARIKVDSVGGETHLTQRIYAKAPEVAGAQRPEPIKSAPKPREIFRRSARLYHDSRLSEFLGRSDYKALCGWSFEQQIWLLSDEPAVLLHQPEPKAKWDVVRKFDFRPMGFAMLTRDRLVVWGTKPTSTPEKGIPYRVEQSLDGGRTWSSLTIPQVDYLTEMAALDNEMIAFYGVRLPKDFAADKGWFELRKVCFVTSDGGAHFTEQGNSFLNIGTVMATSVAPDGLHRAYVENIGFLDPAYRIYVSSQKDHIPAPVATVGVNPKLTWSRDSQILGLSQDGKFFAFVNLRDGSSGKADLDQGKGDPVMDQKVRELLK